MTKNTLLWKDCKDYLFENIDDKSFTDKSVIVTQSVHNILRVVRGIKNLGDVVAYISSPITTGKIYYESLFSNTHLNISTKELIEQNLNIVLQGLIKYDLKIPIIVPALFCPVMKDWEQVQFMYLWYSIIGEQCTEVRFFDDWHYSNGCVQEFTHAKQLLLGNISVGKILYMNPNESFEENDIRMKNMKTKTMNGFFISIDEGLTLIQWTRDYLNKNNIDTTIMNKCINILLELEELGLE
jgi:hypothetical protein